MDDGPRRGLCQLNDRPLFFIQDHSSPLATQGCSHVLARGWTGINIFSHGSGRGQLHEQMQKASFCKFFSGQPLIDRRENEIDSLNTRTIIIAT